MLSNIIDIRTATETRKSARPLPVAGAVILSLRTKRDRQLVYLSKARRHFITAEILWEQPGCKSQAIEMMMQLSCDEKAGAVRSRAATWVWDNMRGLVADRDGLPICPKLRRRALSK